MGRTPDRCGLLFGPEAPPAYRPRDPERTVLHRAVRENVETFLAHARGRGRPAPRFVEREMRGFLECGILAHGLVRVHCDACGHDRVVAFSCKGRGFCPSCGGRRMADTAAHLVDRVLPEAPVRQWVLTVPFALRYRMAYDARFASDVLRVFVRAVFAARRRRARSRVPSRWAQCGAVTFVQRFGDALNLNVHFHTLVLDGVFEGRLDRPPAFHPLPPPDRDELERVVRRIARRIIRLLERRGLDPDGDLLAADEPLLAALYGAALRHRAAGGPRAGQRARRWGDRVDPETLEEDAHPYCVQSGGFSLHAGVAVPARDRDRLERLCRYAARPPVATERLERLPDGRLLYRLRRRWRDGTTHFVFEPEELLERLAALVPPPRAHQVRYHGVLAPCAGRRPRVVPLPPPRAASPCSGPASSAAAVARVPASGLDRDGPRGPLPPVAAPGSRPERDGPPVLAGRGAQPSTPRRFSWAELMRRVFAVDVLQCPRCGGRMRVLAAVHDPRAVRAILECLGLPARPPPNHPARADPKLSDLDV